MTTTKALIVVFNSERNSDGDSAVLGLFEKAP
jgi:hypothetical protein